MLVQIVIESKGRSERRLVDVTTGVVTIGRAPTCTLPIESALISRTHVSVDMNGRRMRVTDSSTNGTLAGDRFVRGSSAEVPFGVPIVLGDHTVWLESSDPSIAKTVESASEKAQKPTLPRFAIHERPSIPRTAFEEMLLQSFAPVRPYLEDPSVREILINGPDRIFVERGGSLERVPATFADRDALFGALRSLSQHLDRPFDEANPILEARLPDGSRVEAIMPPVAPDGPYVALHRSFEEPPTVERLVQSGALTPLAAEALRVMVIARLNVLVAGGAGSGKTSVLNALSGFVPDGERVVVVEGSRELRLQKSHVLRLEAQPADAEGKGIVRVRDLVRAGLRMRPDRVVIGELRGGEALDLVEAMASGHGGCMGTLHAKHSRDALARLETMCTMGDVDTPPQAMRQRIGAGVQLVVQVSRLQDGSRKVTHITEVKGFDREAQRYELEDLFVREHHGVDENGRVMSELVPTYVEPAFLPQLRERGLELPGTMKETAPRAGGVSGGSH
jgi:pilus assembly protein CpaF